MQLKTMKNKNLLHCLHIICLLGGEWITKEKLSFLYIQPWSVSNHGCTVKFRILNNIHFFTSLQLAKKEIRFLGVISVFSLLAYNNQTKNFNILWIAIIIHGPGNSINSKEFQYTMKCNCHTWTRKCNKFFSL